MKSFVLVFSLFLAVCCLGAAPHASDIPDDVMIDVLQLKDMEMIEVLKLLSQKGGLNIIAGSGVRGKVTIYLKDVKLKDALRIILEANGLAYKYEKGIIRVMPEKDFEQRYGRKFAGDMQTDIIHLRYAAAADVVSVLNQMKSPMGKVISEPKSNTLVLTDSLDQLLTMQELV